MEVNQIKTVAVIGAGTMGRQIAMLAALSGRFSSGCVILCTRSALSKNKAGQWAREYLQGRVSKTKLSPQQAENAEKCLTFVDDLRLAVQTADLVIETITEDIQAKRECFAQISAIAKKEAILATNSSNIVSSRLADVTRNPERLLNLHFLNPALVMGVVEVMGGEHTRAETLQTATEFVSALGKAPILLRKEIPGFIVNRINAAVTYEACKLLECGVASAQEIDLACEKGLNYPMGPFRLMDLVGIDVHYQIRSDRYSQSNDPQDAPSPVVVKKVEKGEYGRKTGKGWYTYPQPNQEK